MQEQFKTIRINGDITLDLGVKGVWSCSKSVILNAIIDICNEYQENGYSLTLRQLYYQLVSKDIIPNHDKVYKKLSSLKDDLCYGGYIDWDIFEDRGRIPHLPYYENDIDSALEYTAKTYRINRQEGQNVHVEIWTEKDAISSILKRITDRYGVYLVVNKGYSSSTAMYSAYTRFIEQIKLGKKIHIKYFGDHDPSGLDMVRDIKDRIMYFMTDGSRKKQSKITEVIKKWGLSEDESELSAEALKCYKSRLFEKTEFNEETKKKETTFDFIKAFFDAYFSVEHIGLTMEQIIQYNPPPNPAKITDPRADEYIKRHGDVSWEVDALSPSVMEQIVIDAIESTIDNDIYRKTLEREKKERAQIIELISKL